MSVPRVAMKLSIKYSGAPDHDRPALRRKVSLRRKCINLRFAGRRHPWGLHLGRARSPARRRARLSFEGITATSAGAFNAVVLADGFAAGGREGAKKALRTFWRKLSQDASNASFQPSLIDRMSKSTASTTRRAMCSWNR